VLELTVEAGDFFIIFFFQIWQPKKPTKIIGFWPFWKRNMVLK
jgi:hypothetical protein